VVRSKESPTVARDHLRFAASVRDRRAWRAPRRRNGLRAHDGRDRRRGDARSRRARLSHRARSRVDRHGDDAQRSLRGHRGPAVGTCAGVAGAPHASRAACSDGAGDACAARTCDGARDAKTCAGYAASAMFVCKAGACSGSTWTAPATCNEGTCATPAAVECAPYRCDDAGCRATCSRAEHCIEGNTCIDQKCVPIVATCSPDRLSSTAKDGVVTGCQPYRCTTAGTSGTTCSSSNDCAPLAACDPNSKTCVASATTESDGGCAMSARRTSAWIAYVLALALLVQRRRRVLL